MKFNENETFIIGVGNEESIMDMGEARSPEGVEISLSEPPHNADDALQENEEEDFDWKGALNNAKNAIHKATG